MRKFVWAWLLLGGVCSLIPAQVEAQMFRRPFGACCETCEMPHANCSCTVTRPVVQTQLQARQVMTYRDVTETHVRNETVMQSVPVTTYKQVTVDEGGYQMVWVPKPVTKQVAQTVVQQQAMTRAVPYQVTRRVPQMTTQMVPVQTVQHVTESVPMVTTWAPPPVTFRAASSCNACDSGPTTAFLPQFAPAPYATTFVVPVAPAQAAIPTMPAINVPLPQTALGPAPEAPAQWQTIPSRPVQGANRDYEAPGSRTVPTPSDEARSPRTSQMSSAPSAAIVWNSRR